MVTMQAPTAFQNFQTSSGNAYQSNVSGVINNVAPGDIRDLESAGCLMSLTSITNAAHAANTNPATGATTLTAANITGGAAQVYLTMTGTLGAGANATLPTVASLLAALNNPLPGQTFLLRIINGSGAAFSWTVVTNTGWALTGTMTIAQNTWREFVVTIGNNKTATLQSVGTGTNS